MFIGVARCVELALLLATMVSGVQVPDLSLTLTNERTTIERTYELTKYLEHQLKDIKDTYLSYLGPPFSDPDFSPPRPNSSSLSVPSAATRVELWRGLENGARLAQNQRAYRVLLCAMRELARSTLCPYLQSSLLHFCSGLNGLLGSITGLMGSLGYVSPPQLADGTVLLPSGGVGGGSLLLAEHRASPRAVAPGQHSPAPIRAQQQTQRHHGDHSRQRARDEQRHGGGGAATMGGGGAKEEPARRRGERGRRGRRREEEAATAAAWEVEEMDEEMAREGGMERWGRRRRLLSIDELELEEASLLQLYNINNNNNNNNNDKNNKYTISTQTQVGERDRMDERAETLEDLLYVSSSSSSSSSSSPSSSQHHRSPRSLSSLYSGTLPPSLSLLLQYGPGGAAGVGVGAKTGTSAAAGVPPDGAHSLLAAPLLSAHPVSSEFSRKVEGFWVLRELQSWLWRSAKDFNRLKKRLKA